MKIFTFIFSTILLPSLSLLLAYRAESQNDSSGILKRLPSDTSKLSMNMDAVYNRPFLQYGRLPVALGGYLEANTNYAVTDGNTEGFSFQMRRMTLFVSSTIQQKIKFLSELEFEDGTKEINIEFAALDVNFHHLLNFRGGIIMNPIGAFNQNHDGPKWEFADRPVSATQLLPATFSNVGFGFYGKSYQQNLVWAYELYLTNGFNDHIIANNSNKTFLPATKQDLNRFEESFNGAPLLNAKTSLRLRGLGELGVSYMGGTYNKFEDEGLVLDRKRQVDVLAIDFNTTLKASGTSLIGEFAWVFVDIPSTYTQQYGKKQHGGFIDVVQPILKKKMLGFEKASLNLAVRTEYVDWNKGRFKETGTQISDELFAVVPAISFRTSPQTVFRLNYRYQWQKDILGNPATRTSAIQFGISSYF